MSSSPFGILKRILVVQKDSTVQNTFAKPCVRNVELYFEFMGRRRVGRTPRGGNKIFCHFHLHHVIPCLGPLIKIVSSGKILLLMTYDK